MNGWTYLLVNLGTISMPLMFSLHPKWYFANQWKSMFTAILIVTLPFIAWDMYFTHIGIWSFNEDYLLGINVFNLPIEEVLFFICMPYACLFTFHCIKKVTAHLNKNNYQKPISILLVALFVSMATLNHQQSYTLSTFTLLAMVLLIFTQLKSNSWLTPFYISFLIILLPFFVVNIILTGWMLDATVVLYNDFENLGIRLNTIPVEDIFIGMLLLICNTALYETLKKRAERKNSSTKLNYS